MINLRYFEFLVKGCCLHAIYTPMIASAIVATHMVTIMFAKHLQLAEGLFLNRSL